MFLRDRFVFAVLVTLIETVLTDEIVDFHSTSLRTMVNWPAFVDQTLFIENFFKGPPHKVITAPRRFGKTSKIDLLQTFLEIDVDAKGKVRDDTNYTKNYDIFSTRNLNIFQNVETFKKHFGRYPIIHLNFKSVNASTTQSFIKSFRAEISRCATNFKYLLGSKMLSTKDKNILQEMIDAMPIMTGDRIVSSGHQLAALLQTHHSRDSILLIDNYEVPVLTAIMSEHLQDEELDVVIDKTSQFIAHLTRKDSHVTRSLLTGSFTAGHIYLATAKDLRYYAIFEDPELWKYYGFTEEDVEKLATKFNKKAKLDEIRNWYGGYLVEGLRYHVAAYSPFSIQNFFHYGVFQLYWSEAENLKPTIEHFFDYEKNGEIAEGSLGEEVRIVLHENITERELRILRKVFVEEEFHIIFLHRIIQFLQEAGYYTLCNRNPNSFIGDGVDVFFPNEETKTDFKKLLYVPIFFKSKYQINETMLASYVNCMDKLGNDSNNYVFFATSIVQIFGSRLPRDQEQFHEGLYNLAMASGIFPDVHKNGSEFIVQRHDGAGIVIQSRYSRTSAWDALYDVVVEKKYHDSFDKKSVKNIILIGLFMNERRRCSISYLYNSNDIEKYKNVRVTWGGSA